MTALVDAAIGLKVRNATYRNMAGISDVLASRDLKTLADAKLLIPQGEKRGRFYLASEPLRRMGDAAKVGETKRIPDPFDLGGYLPGFVPLP